MSDIIRISAAMGSLQLFLNQKHAAEFLSADYYFHEKPQSLHPVNRTAAPLIAWSLPQSPRCSPLKLGYRAHRAHNRSRVLHRFCCQSAANFDQLPSVIQEVHTSNSAVNTSPLDGADPRRGLGIVEFIKEKTFLSQGPPAFWQKVK